MLSFKDCLVEIQRRRHQLGSAVVRSRRPWTGSGKWPVGRAAVDGLANFKPLGEQTLGACPQNTEHRAEIAQML